MTVTIAARSLSDFVRDIFRAGGCSNEEGGRIGHYLVEANLTGHDSHGVIRVPRYVQMLRDKTLVPDVTVDVVVDTPVLAVVDGKYGFGQTVAPQAVRIGIDKCRKAGLSAVALRNAGHTGRTGDFAEMAAAEGLVSVHFVNARGSVLVAPYGGVDRRFSTAPYCVGIPRAGLPPLVLDFATSIVAEGKVLVASQGGKKVPDDALIGPDGAPSGDPHLLYGDYTPDGPRIHRHGKGAIRAFGEHKGSGLAFMCELLGGALTGNGATQDGQRFANGMFSFYVDPKVVDPAGVFGPEVARYTEAVKTSRPTAAGGEVLVPGEPEIRTRAKRMADGIPLPDDTWASIVGAARLVGLDERRIQQAAR
ncbi:MAG: malate/lactate/ureidoglycolate dehydrogenase [Alphaproteobacteria bacterium]|nr:malate/lactate/ureidoglycolate dehydrogenase [Alphaproteobacteria bacterium]